MEKKVNLVSVNMGYGHQRTAFPLKHLAYGEKIIQANDYEGIPKRDKEIWERSRRFYEFLSIFKRASILGEISFSFYNQFQKIFSFYPKIDLSRPNFAVKQIFSLIRKGWGEDLIKKLATNPLPLVSTFFIPAFMAEYFDYPGEIFCVVCDADISRSWASLFPGKSRIKYFAPTERVAERLKLYGVKKENIFLTGYPLPIENIGGEEAEILKEDLKNRLLNLDPKKRYFSKYSVLVETELGKLPEKSNHSLTLLFSIGGAGAQKEIGKKIVKNLTENIKRGEIKIILSVGARKDVWEYFKKESGQGIEVFYQEKIEDYFREFNQKLRKVDILWTKPSELSFYSALAIPIIIAPPIGSQEEFNERWLLKSGFGIKQENPDYIGQWLFDWLNNGYLAEMAMEGFIEGEKIAVLNISRIINQL